MLQSKVIGLEKDVSNLQEQLEKRDSTVKDLKLKGMSLQSKAQPLLETLQDQVRRDHLAKGGQAGDPPTMCNTTLPWVKEFELAID